MNPLKLILSRLSLLGLAICSTQLHAQSADQTLSLVTGWNSVWLEVEPVYAVGDTVRGNPAAVPPVADEVLAAGDRRIGRQKAPRDVFTNPEITVVASPQPLAGLSEFFSSEPGTIGTFNQEEWQQWKRTDPVGTNNLGLVLGNRPYLIQVSSPVAPLLTGTVKFHRPTWTPDRYNLIGFGLDGSPTFDAFFGPSGSRHAVANIFKLNSASGNWQRVTGSDAMVSGEAYWVYSSGPSSYMGPVSVDFKLAPLGRMDFGGPGDAVSVDSGADALTLDLLEVVFSNLGSTDASPELDLIVQDPGSGSLDLHVVRPADDRLGYLRGNRVDSMPGETAASSDLGETISAQSTETLTIGALRDWSFGTVGRTNVYRLKTGAGTAVWLPISASNNDLQLPTDMLPDSDSGSVAGLWVGEVIVDPISSIVVDGAPTLPAAAPAPLRILMHSNEAGEVHFLSQVTVMQTKSADPEVAPVPVLVVDPARIPFFEGVRERGGKRVGLRLEAVAFDMPRDTSIDGQSDGDPADGDDDLIDRVVAESTSPSTKWLSGAGQYTDRASVDQAALQSYILFRSIRPPALKEIYKNSLPMNGALGAGKTVATHPGSLVLDPFHRSNPFRHAYHQNLPKGPQIVRELTIVFDAEQPVPGRLRGTYREEVDGLIKSRLTVTGTINLKRANSVSILEGAE